MTQIPLGLIEQILTAALTAAGYSVLFYAKQVDGNSPENFDRLKFLSTVLVGACVGGLMSISGIGVDKMTIQQRLAAYAGIIAVVESVIKVLVRKGRKMRSSNASE